MILPSWVTPGARNPGPGDLSKFQFFLRDSCGQFFALAQTVDPLFRWKFAFPRFFEYPDKDDCRGNQK
jgi:hypothetical protein